MAEKKDNDSGCIGWIFLLAILAGGVWLLWTLLTGFPRTCFWIIAPIASLGILFGIGFKGAKALLTILLMAGIIWWGLWAHHSGPTEGGKIMFITDISNAFGRISPAMEIGIFCGQEDPELNDMIDRFYKELKNYKYKEKTRKIGAKDELPINILLTKIMGYIGKKPDARITKYLGNIKILTDVPVGESFYCYAAATWDNGNRDMIWVKKIVVKRGENKIILVNDGTAFESINHQD